MDMKHTPEPWAVERTRMIREAAGLRERLDELRNISDKMHAKTIALRATVAEQSGIITDQQNACVDMQQNEMRLTNTVAELVEHAEHAATGLGHVANDMGQYYPGAARIVKQCKAAIAKAREVLGG